jgi:hypothetical protein
MMSILGDIVNLVSLEGETNVSLIIMFHSSIEEYHSYPTRLALLDSWIDLNEHIETVVCGSRFIALLTTSFRLILL